jgi:DNA adenine methylase
VRRFEKGKTKAALSYYGGKTRALSILRRHMPRGLKAMVSPFLGGGSFEVAMARRGTRVHAYDAEPALVCFWHYQTTDPYGLFAAVKALGEPTNEQLHRWKKTLPEVPDSIDRAALYYLVNKSSWMGMTLAGGIHRTRRATRSMKHDIHRFCAPRLSVECLRFEDSLARHPDLFAYLDPPYIFENPSAAKLYGVAGELHQDFDHHGLFEAVKGRGQWIMSQADNDTARSLYSGFTMISPQWAYGGVAQCRELLIFSRDLEPRIS